MQLIYVSLTINASGNIYCIFAGFQVLLAVTGMLVDLFVTIMQVTVSVAIMQLEVFTARTQVAVSAANMWLTIFVVIMQMEVSCCNYAGCIFCSTLYIQKFKMHLLQFLRNFL